MRAAQALSENSITPMLSLFGVKPSQLKSKRLCRLFSSVAFFSATNEDYEYRVWVYGCLLGEHPYDGSALATTVCMLGVPLNRLLEILNTQWLR